MADWESAPSFSTVAWHYEMSLQDIVELWIQDSVDELGPVKGLQGEGEDLGHRPRKEAYATGLYSFIVVSTVSSGLTRDPLASSSLPPRLHLGYTLL